MSTPLFLEKTYRDFDRVAVISYMKKVAEQSLSSQTHDNDKLLWPGGKRTQSDKFALTY